MNNKEKHTNSNKKGEEKVPVAKKAEIKNTLLLISNAYQRFLCIYEGVVPQESDNQG